MEQGLLHPCITQQLLCQHSRGLKYLDSWATLQEETCRYSSQLPRTFAKSADAIAPAFAQRLGLPAPARMAARACPTASDI